MTQLIDAEGWLTSPLFIQIAGHPAKIYTEPNTGENGLGIHSVVGEEADFLDGVPERFLSDQRVPGNPERFTDYAAASILFVLRKRMHHVQMYPVECATWSSGGREANTTTWAMEAEGGGPGNYSEPLTDHQIRGFLAIAAAWEQRFGRRLVDGKTVRPHWQIARDYGYAPTACESNRYAQARLHLARGTAPTPEEESMATEAEIRTWAREEADAVAGGAFLPLLAQALGVDAETFSDDDKLTAIRRALGERTAVLDQLSILSRAFQELADGAVAATAIAATAAEPKEDN